MLIVVVALLTANTPGVTATLAAVSFHVHLLIDVVGTGGLPIRYLWPLSDRAMSWHGDWVLASWENVGVMAAVAAGVAMIEWRRRRAV